ncbi:MAG: KamA family radical SAM protein [Bdellovibrionales bacterium]
MFKDFTGELKTNQSLNWDWLDWKAQLKHSYKTKEDFLKRFELGVEEEKGFLEGSSVFNIQSTPYYTSLADAKNPQDPIRRMILPRGEEVLNLNMTQNDPLGENKNRPCERLVHRYSDRVLFLVTDYCGIYCRYCTRKHFTGGGKVLPAKDEYQEALDYIKKYKGIREVILSGGDPLTLSNSKLDKILSDLDEIPHVELIRVGSRMPAACPMRLDEGLLKVFKKDTPIVLMSHFNHHQEVSLLAKKYLRNFAENGVQIFNQMVLLNGVNNSAALVYKLSRELISCKVFPYYMFQCDPSPGTSHLQIPIQESLKIQRELWGHSSGLAMPIYSVDIPSGGGKTYLTPNYIESFKDEAVEFKGFDGVRATYLNPLKEQSITPYVSDEVSDEWRSVKNSKEVL